jgi:hypothetical protein
MRRIVVSLLLLFAPHASAATMDCSAAGNGTPCAGPCIASGVCGGGTCHPTSLIKDNTPCVSGNPCTTGDQCQNGVCQPGTMVVCPGSPPCLQGVCDPVIGCKMVSTCDMAQPPLDLSSSSDLAGSTDLAGASTDLAGASTDLATTSTDLMSLGDLAPFIPVDDFGLAPDGAPPADAFALGHVRGSALGGGCGCGIGGAGGAAPSSLLLLLLLSLRPRRRRG